MRRAGSAPPGAKLLGEEVAEDDKAGAVVGCEGELGVKKSARFGLW